MAVASTKVCVGIITKAHGIKGHVYVHSYCDNPADIFDYHPVTDASGHQNYTLKPIGVARDMLIASVNDISDRNEAEALAKTELYIDRSQLKAVERDDEFYVSDLIGLTVLSEQRSVLGSIVHVDNFGAGDILGCKAADQASFMIPFTEDAVVSVDLDAKCIVISAMAESFIHDKGESKQ